MKILVTGANGMLGQDLCSILKNYKYKVIETDIHNLDITSFTQCEQIIKKELPDVIIHCAAYTNVDKAESDPNTATQINVDGTENIAKICSQIDAKLVYISTDYVFDGEKTSPYNTEDSPNPINNYGLTKFQGEIAVKKYCNKYFIVRTSWLYGHYGNNFIEKMLSLKGQNSIKVVTDQIGCPTWTVDLTNGIVQLIKYKDFGIYHICGSGETSWYEFAKEIFNLSNININIEPCSSKEFNSPAKRPKYSVLKNSFYSRNWQDALKEYLYLRK